MWRLIVAPLIVIICVYSFSFWGLLSLPVAIWIILSPLFKSKSSCVTDYNSADSLGSAAPLSFRKMQDILVDISKNRINDETMNCEMSELLNLLRKEVVQGRELSDCEILSGYTVAFQSSFPNWQKEYSVIFNYIDNLPN